MQINRILCMIDSTFVPPFSIPSVAALLHSSRHVSSLCMVYTSFQAQDKLMIKLILLHTSTNLDTRLFISIFQYRRLSLGLRWCHTPDEVHPRVFPVSIFVLFRIFFAFLPISKSHSPASELSRMGHSQALRLSEIHPCWWVAACILVETLRFCG